MTRAARLEELDELKRTAARGPAKAAVMGTRVARRANMVSLVVECVEVE